MWIQGIRDAMEVRGLEDDDCAKRRKWRLRSEKRRPPYSHSQDIYIKTKDMNKNEKQKMKQKIIKNKRYYYYL